MLADKTNFGSVLYNHANFYQFEETSNYWLVELISIFFSFSLINQRHTSSIIVYNPIVTNIENPCWPCIAAIAGSITSWLPLKLTLLHSEMHPSECNRVKLQSYISEMSIK